MLTSSGIRSAPGLLGRGSPASSSRGNRKSRLSVPVLYQDGGARRRRPCPGAHARVRRLFEGRVGEAGSRAGDRLLRFQRGEGAGTSTATSLLYQDGCHIGAVILVQSSAKRLIRPGSGQSLFL